MRTALVISALLPLVLAPPSGQGGGSYRHDGSFDISVHGHGGPADCSDLEIEAPGRSVETAQEHLTVERGKSALTVAAGPRGGVVVTGWEGDHYDVVACKAAVGEDGAGARALLAEVTVHERARALVTAGPAGEDWLVYLIIRAPRGAAMELSAENGPLSLRRAQGRFAIRGANGPVSLDEVEGEVSVEVENGPVSIAAGAGSMSVRTENGPIAVSLAGTDWEGQGLDARAVNGPLSLELGEGYRGGVRIESAGHAPWSCGGPCARAERTRVDGGRQLELGPQPARVRLSTVNGPVSITEP